MPFSTADEAISDDPLIQKLIKGKGKRVEIVAFGISYVGILEILDEDDGVAIVSDGHNEAMIELERIDSVTV
ncbi:hypothetical protein KKA47_04950, partial [bacterium]|nr:hypothetical protein [bacterium]